MRNPAQHSEGSIEDRPVSAGTERRLTGGVPVDHGDPTEISARDHQLIEAALAVPSLSAHWHEWAEHRALSDLFFRHWGWQQDLPHPLGGRCVVPDPGLGASRHEEDVWSASLGASIRIGALIHHRAWTGESAQPRLDPVFLLSVHWPPSISGEQTEAYCATLFPRQRAWIVSSHTVAPNGEIREGEAIGWFSALLLPGEGARLVLPWFWRTRGYRGCIVDDVVWDRVEEAGQVSAEDALHMRSLAWPRYVVEPELSIDVLASLLM